MRISPNIGRHKEDKRERLYPGRYFSAFFEKNYFSSRRNGMITIYIARIWMFFVRNPDPFSSETICDIKILFSNLNPFSGVDYHIPVGMSLIWFNFVGFNLPLNRICSLRCKLKFILEYQIETQYEMQAGNDFEHC